MIEQLVAITQCSAGVLREETVIFKEHGLQFGANVIKGHKTGYFLDHRHNRKRIGELAKGRKVLDVFAYAGGFSVHAIAGGASSVTSLDISKQALAVAQQNMALNFPASDHQIMAIDAFKGLAKLYQTGNRFDLIIVDPPSFAKKESDIKKAIYQYAELAKLAARLVNRQGILLLASCSSRVTKELFYETVLTAVKETNIPFSEMERNQHDMDHPIGFKEGAYLKSIYLRIGR